MFVEGSLLSNNGHWGHAFYHRQCARSFSRQRDESKVVTRYFILAPIEKCLIKSRPTLKCHDICELKGLSHGVQLDALHWTALACAVQGERGSWADFLQNESINHLWIGDFRR